MPKYTVTDPQTGRKVTLTGDSPPTDQELEDIFSSLPAPKQIDQQAQPQKDQYEGDKLQILNPFGENIQTPIPLGGRTEKFMQGMGLGFSEVGRGVKRLTGFGEENINAEYDRALTENSGAALGGKIVGNALPFLPAGLASVGTSAARNIGYQALVGGLEGSTVQAGSGGSASDIVGGGLLGASIGGGVQAVSPYVGRLLGSLAKKYGFSSADELIDPLTGAPNQAARDILAREGVDPATLTAPLQSAELATAPAIKRAEEVAATMAISPERVAAHQRAGIQAPIAALTDDVAAQEMGGALAAVHGSKASEALSEYTKALTAQAKKITDEAVGTLDSGAINVALKQDMQNTIEKLGQDSSVIYKKINELVPQNTIVNSRPILDDLYRLASSREKGIAGLSGVEQKVFQTLKDKPRYADVDALRKDIGRSVGKITGPYVNEDAATLNRLYSQLSQVQEGVANQVGNGAGSLWKNAKDLDVSRFKLQDDSKYLFGEGLEGGATKKLEGAIKALSARDPKAFNQMIDSIPESYRPKTVMTAMDSIMRKSYSSGKELDANGFAKFWGELSESPTNKAMLTKHLPDGAAKRLDDMYTMAQSLTNITKNKTKTGIIPDAMKDFNQTNGIVGKLYGFAQNAPMAPSATVRALGVVADIATKARTDAVKAADDLLASQTFRDAVLAADRGPKIAKIAEERLKRSKVFKNFINESDNKALNRWKSQAVTGSSVSGGPSFIQYLLNGEEDQSSQ